MNLSKHQQDLVEYLKVAIEDEMNIEVLYTGFKRVATPHSLAETRDGRVVLHCYQFGGDSSKGPVTPESGGWRWLYLEQIESLAIGPGPTYPSTMNLNKATYEPPQFIKSVLAMRASQ